MLYIMPTGEAEIIKEIKDWYIVRFETGEEIYIPKDIIDNAIKEYSDG